MAHRGSRLSTKSGRTWKYRSGWERALMEALDADARVAAWDYESVSVEYCSSPSSGRIRHYWPDFRVTWVDGAIEHVEVKPASRMTQPKNLKKFEAAAAALDNFSVITEVELSSQFGVRFGRLGS